MFRHAVTELRFTDYLCSERRCVRHYWFTSWPDHHIPQCTAPLLRLVEEVEMYSKSLLPPSSQPITAPMPGSGPIIVHCSAGIGRTGCFIASSIGSQQLRETGQVDILETVCQLRLDRGGMIQTTEQYQFLYTTLAQYSSQLQHNQVFQLIPGFPVIQTFRKTSSNLSYGIKDFVYKYWLAFDALNRRPDGSSSVSECSCVV
ncbi:tyrosine-protein phosphatase non-receptor type 7-like [Thunnus thynnus]|uniref:tyrosine-protein phosphatase non-receptor type 7-like n=1 Tax=Thunnus thynnus TaxID=8237 RepID=UPI0035280639